MMSILSANVQVVLNKIDRGRKLFCVPKVEIMFDLFVCFCFFFFVYNVWVDLFK